MPVVPTHISLDVGVWPITLHMLVLLATASICIPLLEAFGSLRSICKMLEVQRINHPPRQHSTNDWLELVDK